MATLLTTDTTAFLFIDVLITHSMRDPLLM